MTQQTAPRHRPSGSVLAGLGAAVLVVHLLLLTDGLPSIVPASPTSGEQVAPLSVAVETRTLSAEPSRPLPASLSTVRWLAPPAAQPAVDTAPSKPPPAATAPPRSRPPEPAPAPTITDAMPPPSPTPPIEASAPAAQPDPVEPVTERVPAPERPAEPAAPEHLAAKEEAAATDLLQMPGESTELAAAARRSPPAGKGGNARLPPALPPASAQLNYLVEGKARGLQYSASGVLDWTHGASAYSARMEIRVFLLGSRVQTSQGGVVASGLQPERFGDKSRSERAAHFDRALGRIRFSNNAPDAELLPGAQDRLSVFFQLAGLLNARPDAYVKGQSVSVPVAGIGGLEVWRFELQGQESLKLPAGELVALHLVREPRQPHDTRVDIWLAPGLGHLPVRIRITQDNGDVVDQQLSALP